MSSSTAGKTRSPNYPSIGIEEAIQRIRTIYEKQQRYPATREVLAQLMGYSGLNGASVTIVSALSKYGLIEGHGESLRVSEMGQDLVLHRRGDLEYTSALQEAAYLPVFFRELRDQFPTGLPHDHSLRATLIKRGFNPKSVEAAIRTYRETVDFVAKETVGIADRVDDELPVSGPIRVPDESATSVDLPTKKQEGGQRVIFIPLSISEWVTLEGPFPVSEASWNQMIVVLQAMKPALIRSDSEQQSASEARKGPDL